VTEYLHPYPAVNLVLPSDAPWLSPTYFYLQINSLGSQNVSAEVFVSPAVCSLTTHEHMILRDQSLHRKKWRSNFCFGQNGNRLKNSGMPHKIWRLPGLPTCHRLKVVSVPRKHIFRSCCPPSNLIKIFFIVVYNEWNPYLSSVSLDNFLSIANIYSPGSRKVRLHYWHKRRCFLFSVVSIAGFSNRFGKEVQ
jgi:hypothetical protein